MRPPAIGCHPNHPSRPVTGPNANLPAGYRERQGLAYFASIAALISGTLFPCLYIAYASSVMSWHIAHPYACRST